MSDYITSRSPFIESELRNAMGNFATGVTVITTIGNNRTKVGVTANSFSSVSLDPAIVLWSLKKTSSSLSSFDECGHFAVHILASTQVDLSNRFASKSPDKFAGVSHVTGFMGIPIIDDCICVFECKTTERISAGDHILFLAEVLSFSNHAKQGIDQEPLLFVQGQYAQSSPVAFETLK